MKKFIEMTSAEREAFVVFQKFAVGSQISMRGLEKMAEDMSLDYDILRALTDDDGNHRVTFEEFCGFWNSPDKFFLFQGEKFESLRKWLEFFNSVDTDANGTLSIAEIKTFCDSQGFPIDVDQLIAALDKDKSGNIGFEEFLTWYKYPI
jgi:Ca2+-binding EF-hand superfamily protein